MQRFAPIERVEIAVLVVEEAACARVSHFILKAAARNESLTQGRHAIRVAIEPAARQNAGRVAALADDARREVAPLRLHVARERSPRIRTRLKHLDTIQSLRSTILILDRLVMKICNQKEKVCVSYDAAVVAADCPHSIAEIDYSHSGALDVHLRNCSPVALARIESLSRLEQGSAIKSARNV